MRWSKVRLQTCRTALHLKRRYNCKYGLYTRKSEAVTRHTLLQLMSYVCGVWKALSLWLAMVLSAISMTAVQHHVILAFASHILLVPAHCTSHAHLHPSVESTSEGLPMQRHPDDSPRDQGRQKAHQEATAEDCKLGLLPGQLSASALLTAVAACAHHSLPAPPCSVRLPLCKQNP